MIKNKKIFITGGAGFIGTALCEILIKDNVVTIYDNFHRNSIKNTHLIQEKNLNLISGDVLDYDKLCECVKGHNIFVHMAAIAGIDTVIKKPITTVKVNLLGTYNLLEALVKTNFTNTTNEIERFVLFSTSEIYGPLIYNATEDAPSTQGQIGETRWSYATSKIAAEHLAYSYFLEYNFPLVIIRPFNVYGPRQVGEGAIHKFIIKAIRNENITVFNDGTQIRAWCYIDDFADGLKAAIEKEKAIGEVFNLGNPKGTITTLGLAEKVIYLSKSKSKIIFQTNDAPDVQVRVPSIKKAEQLLEFTPKIDLDSGILRTLDWYGECL